jgi:hypothetical protein
LDNAIAFQFKDGADANVERYDDGKREIYVRKGEGIDLKNDVENVRVIDRVQQRLKHQQKKK